MTPGRRPSPIRFIARLADDRRGVSAVEFALLAPVIFIIYFGLVQLCEVYMADRRTGHTAAMVSDLVAQSDVTKKAELDRVFDIGQMIMKPFPEAPLMVRVSSVTLDPSGVPRVDWSHSDGLPGLAKGSIYADLPAGLAEINESLVVGETRYTYPSGFAKVLPNSIVLTRKYYLRPRTVNTVVCSDC